jgi:diguanylate cyclase (GGDEF)-like protein
MMVIAAGVAPLVPADPSDPQRSSDAADRPGRPAELALSAFMSMARAVAIVGRDGKLIMPNLAFDRLFHDSDLVDRINCDAGRNDGKSDRRITLPDGRSFWVETIPMEDGWLVSAYDMTERSAKENIDTLTKLGNRMMFQGRLTELLASPDVPTESAAVLTIELDRFQAIKELLGRETGGELLRIVANRIRSALDHAEVVARLQGGRFCIIQTGQMQPQSAAALAGRLIEAIGRPYMLDGHLIDLAANAGIVLFPAGSADCDQVMSGAELALGRARADGHGTYRFFEKAMDESMQHRRSLEIDLRRALALGEFSLAYQPQLNLRLNTVTGFEALLRWQSPTRGAVPPVDFIPVAEDSGAINSIGEWVLRNACREAATWPGDRIVSVNVSPVQFANPNFIATILSALGESGLDPRRLELEITERVLLDIGPTAMTMMQRLRASGVRISLDDFGTGFASLGYLRSFPFDKIKIDQSFIRGASSDAIGQAFVRTIASLGQSLGMATVAEGVETEEQMARVVCEGCTDVQGYLVSRPMPPEEIESFLHAQQSLLPAAVTPAATAEQNAFDYADS